MSRSAEPLSHAMAVLEKLQPGAYAGGHLFLVVVQNRQAGATERGCVIHQVLPDLAEKERPPLIPALPENARFPPESPIATS